MAEGPKRYRTIECQDCGGLDTYGNEEYADLGRAHARESGHHVVMWVEYRIDINEPASPSREFGLADGVSSPANPPQTDAPKET